MMRRKNISESVITGLADHGWATLPGCFSTALTDALGRDLRQHEESQPLRLAGTGSGGREVATAAAAIRTDLTLWLDGTTPAQREYFGIMEALRLDLNRALYLGLFDYECHYALYAPGGFYKKHIDALRGGKNRIVSCVTYLTSDWSEADEGHLVLYGRRNQEQEVARILPEAGTLAVFLSEEVPHEVLPPARERVSIAGWFRCNASGSDRVDPLR